MKEARELIRLKFEAETDIIINNKTKNWRKYALWLENINILKLKNHTAKENKLLRKVMHKTTDMLDQALMTRITD